jgi:hypothetical protein
MSEWPGEFLVFWQRQIPATGVGEDIVLGKEGNSVGIAVGIAKVYWGHWMRARIITVRINVSTRSPSL